MNYEVSSVNYKWAWKCDGNDFTWAISQLRQGKKVSRKGWNGKGMWIELQVPDEGSKMSLPYLYMKTADNKLVPWLASQTDILEFDWGPVEP